MFGFGSLSHLIVIFIVALIFIGPKQLPEVARTLGRMLNELRRASNMFTSQFNSQLNDYTSENKNETPTPPPPPHVEPTYSSITPQDAVGEQLDLVDVTNASQTETDKKS